MSFSQAPLGEVRRKRFCNRTKFLMIKDIQSRPTRARGLKPLPTISACRSEKVAPHAGAWIETCLSGYLSLRPNVAPHAGAWIETWVNPALGVNVESRPTRARGLKLLSTYAVPGTTPVAPHAGAWIETTPCAYTGIGRTCRAPRGRVD